MRSTTQCIPYRVPPVEMRPQRLDALLAVIYQIFNEGYCASGGDTLTRSDLCGEAIRLCRILVDLLPQSAEVHGLLALMLLHDSRHEARLNAAGELVLLDEQDRARWNQARVHEGIAVLKAAFALHDPGPYQVQAAISTLHALAPMAEATDWRQIATLYDTLATMTPSVVVEVNRAVAMAMAWGAERGLQMLLCLDSQADGFYPYQVARADLMRQTNQSAAAADAYARALALCGNRAERVYLQRRLREMLNLAR